MAQRDIPFEPWADRILLRSPPHWTAVLFFGALGGLHLFFSVPAFVVGYWEGYLSLVLGTAFASGSLIAFSVRRELLIDRHQKRIVVRHGPRPVCGDKTVPFNRIRGVRLTLTAPPKYPGSHIELLCDEEEVECPMTPMPRQQAMLLAMLFRARLIKVCCDDGEAELKHGE